MSSREKKKDISKDMQTSSSSKEDLIQQLADLVDNNPDSPYLVSRSENTYASPKIKLFINLLQDIAQLEYTEKNEKDNEERSKLIDEEIQNNQADIKDLRGISRHILSEFGETY